MADEITAGNEGHEASADKGGKVGGKFLVLRHVSYSPRLDDKVLLVVEIDDMEHPDRPLYGGHFVRRLYQTHIGFNRSPLVIDPPDWSGRPPPHR